MRKLNPSRFHRGNPQRRSKSPSDHAAFTLVEMLLVLGVLAVITAVAWPNVIKLTRQQTLLDASDKVRSVAASARVHAIESGLIWQFRYEPGGQHFIVVPFEREVEAINPNTRGAGVASGLGRFSKAAGTLPKSVSFAASGTIGSSTTAPPPTAAMGGGQQISSDALSGLPDAGKLSAVAWSAPILFYPNGSAGDVVVDLIDRQHQYVTMRIRGVTGAVSVSRLHVQGKK